MIENYIPRNEEDLHLLCVRYLREVQKFTKNFEIQENFSNYSTIYKIDDVKFTCNERKKFGYTPGFPDITLHRKPRSSKCNTKTIYIEFKFGNNNLTESQKKVGRLLYPYYVVRDLWELKKYLLMEGILSVYKMEKVDILFKGYDEFDLTTFFSKLYFKRNGDRISSNNFKLVNMCVDILTEFVILKSLLDNINIFTEDKFFLLLDYLVNKNYSKKTIFHCMYHMIKCYKLWTLDFKLKTDIEITVSTISKKELEKIIEEKTNKSKKKTNENIMV